MDGRKGREGNGLRLSMESAYGSLVVIVIRAAGLANKITALQTVMIVLR